MDNCEWIKKCVIGKTGGAVPYNFMFTPPVEKLLKAHYKTDNIEDKFNFPARFNGPASIKPLYSDPAVFGETIKDEFGVIWHTCAINRGSPKIYPLMEPDLKGYQFPDPSAAYRFVGLKEWCDQNRGRYRVLWVGDLWERATFMRPHEEMLMDLYLNSDFVKALLRGLTDHILATMDILFTKCDFECIALSDDYGTQKALTMSPEMWREFLKPLVSEIYGAARKRGKNVFHHSCGNLEAIIPDLIEIGLDIMHPIQPEAMDILALKKEFGGDLAFCGGVGTQEFLPKASPREVVHEVRRLKEKMGAGGGFILEPGITLQADVPLENLVALIETAVEK
jgi:uroporphyrinogen decarboxylase